MMDRATLAADETLASTLHGTTREYYFAVYLNMLDWLVDQYREDCSRTAELCDKKLDRSGRLLGRVRELASRTSTLRQGEPR